MICPACKQDVSALYEVGDLLMCWDCTPDPKPNLNAASFCEDLSERQRASSERISYAEADRAQREHFNQ